MLRGVWLEGLVTVCGYSLFLSSSIYRSLSFPLSLLSPISLTPPTRPLSLTHSIVFYTVDGTRFQFSNVFKGKAHLHPVMQPGSHEYHSPVSPRYLTHFAAIMGRSGSPFTPVSPANLILPIKWIDPRSTRGLSNYIQVKRVIRAAGLFFCGTFSECPGQIYAPVLKVHWSGWV